MIVRRFRQAGDRMEAGLRGELEALQRLWDADPGTPIRL